MEEIERSVRGYAAEVVAGGRVDRITAVTRFTAGRRHAVFRVTFDAGEDVVVRFATDPEAQDGARAEHEARVIERLEGVAAPRLLDFRRESPWFDGPSTCVEYVAGGQRPLSACDEDDLAALGSVVAAVHAHTGDDDVRSAAAYLDAHLSLLAGKLAGVRDGLSPSERQSVDRLWSAVTERAGAMKRSESFDDVPLVLLHGDISGDNVLWGLRPVLIDWEYTRTGDPADELAYAFGQNWLTADQRAAFWRGYGGASRALLDRVAWWEPVTLLGSALWWLERNGREEAIRRLDAVEALLA